VPQTIGPGSSYGCSFTAFVGGNAGVSETSVSTVIVSDDEGTSVSASDDATVTVMDAAPVLTVRKTAPATVPEPGGSVVFSLELINDSSASDPVTITSIVDDPYGDLSDGGNPSLESTTCRVGQTIQPGATYVCTFSASVAGNAGSSETDVVTVVGTDDDDGPPVESSDDATVNIVDASPTLRVTKTVDPATIPEPGGVVTFSVRVENTSNIEDPVSLLSLVDDIYGDLTDLGSEAGTVETQLSTTCSVPQPIAPGAAYECSFDAEISGNGGEAFTDTVTAIARDDEDREVSKTDAASVTLTNAAPALSLVVSPSHAAVPEPGANVTFTIETSNESVSSDPVTLEGLVGLVFGNVANASNPKLAATGCSLPRTIDPGSSSSCSFTALVSGNAGDEIVETLTASARDDEAAVASASGQARVGVSDVPPALTVLKTAAPSVVAAPGGVVTFSVEVTNASASTDPVTLTGLSDDVYGALDGRGNCALPQSLAAGQIYGCSFEAIVRGASGEFETDTVTAVVRDDEGGERAGIGSATVNLGACVSTVVVAPETVTGLAFVGSCDTIEAGSGYLVGDGGDVTFAAGTAIVLTNGFSVEAGGTFAAEVQVP
jgi:hypothetical protein